MVARGSDGVVPQGALQQAEPWSRVSHPAGPQRGTLGVAASSLGGAGYSAMPRGGVPHWAAGWGCLATFHPQDGPLCGDPAEGAWKTGAGQPWGSRHSGGVSKLVWSPGLLPRRRWASPSRDSWSPTDVGWARPRPRDALLPSEGKRCSSRHSHVLSLFRPPVLVGTSALTSQGSASAAELSRCLDLGCGPESEPEHFLTRPRHAPLCLLRQ